MKNLDLRRERKSRKRKKREIKRKVMKRKKKEFMWAFVPVAAGPPN